MKIHSVKYFRFLKPSAWMAAAAAASLLAPASALAQYNWVNSTNQTGNWNAAARWSGGPAGTFPNAVDATATLSQPLSNAPSGNYNVQLSNTAGQLITIGGLTVNNYVGANDTANLRIGANGNGALTFQASTGSAFYTENAGPGTENTSAGITNIYAPVTFASDTVITQNHATGNNNGTQFSSTANSPGGITAAPGITVTKEGAGNVSFEVAPTAPGTGFQGALVINNGAVRQADNVFANASSVTVNNGGQFQIGSSTVTNWSLAPGASLYLNGDGKASGANALGAFRQNNNTAVTSFDSPVVLQSKSNIAVQGTSLFTLSKAVSGPGGLDKSNGGTLIFGGTDANTYGGATNVLGGTLQLAKPAGVNAIPGDVAVQNPTGAASATLQLAASDQIVDSSNVTIYQSTATGTPNGTFALNGFSEAIGSLNSTGGAGIVQNGAATASTLSINAAAGSSAFSGVLQDGGAGTLALAVSGSQPVALSGASTYSGGTTVTGGTLVADNVSGSATGSGPVVISAGGELHGSGAIAGAVSFDDATLAPGNSPGTLTLGSTSFTSLSTLAYELGAPGIVGSGINDLTIVLGDLTLGGTLEVSPLSGFGAGVYRLFDYTGSLVDNGLAITGLPAGYLGSLDLSIANQVNLNVNAVPEPATWTLLLVGSLGLVAAGHRRRGRVTKK